MKKKTLIITMLITALFLITPSIPANQFSIAAQDQKEYIQKQINIIYNNENQLESFSNIKSLINEIANSLTEESNYNINKGKFPHQIKSLLLQDDNNPQPQALLMLGLFIYGLLFWVLFKIVLFILGDIGTFLGSIKNNIKTRISNVFNRIFNFIRIILNIIVTIILGVLGTFAGAIMLIIGVILFIVYAIIQLALLIWNVIGTTIGLLLQIIQLIFETIFPFINGNTHK